MSSIPTLLSASDLHLSYGTQVLLDGISLTVAPGEKVALVGRNGCGKTSLLKILSGENPPDAGEISRRRGIRVGYLPQEFELDPAATVLANIQNGAADLVEWMRRYESGDGSESALQECLERIQHADGWNLETRIKSLAGALHAPALDAVVGPLSGGEKRRVALCRALASQPDLLLLDEPTNHLDAESTSWLEDFLRGFPGAVVLVTHDRYFLETVATRIVEIAFGKAHSHPGNYAAYLESRALRQQIATQAERRRQRFIRAELEFVRAGVRAQRSKSKHRLESFYKVADQDTPPEEREMDLLIPPAPELGNTAIELENAGVRLEPDGRWLFRHLDLSLRPGECTGIVGRNGAGKSTLLRVCLGQQAPTEGTATIGKRVILNYIDQGRMRLDTSHTVLQELGGDGGTIRFGTQDIPVRSWLRRFLFEDARMNESVEKLSGGERARLLLAKVLCRGGNVLVLDEPTNDLDLGSLRILEEALAAFEGTVLVVSHDRYFLDRICDRIVAFEEGGVHVQPGNFSYYLDGKKARQARYSSLATGSFPKPANAPAPQSPARRKLSNKQLRELESMEATILDAEKNAADLEVMLNDSDLHDSRPAEVPAVIARLEEQRREIERLYARWEELSSL
jgi:ABC transport system ATP-binding/permease protein